MRLHEAVIERWNSIGQIFSPSSLEPGGGSAARPGMVMVIPGH